jgi:hypothetical protein
VGRGFARSAQSVPCVSVEVMFCPYCAAEIQLPPRGTDAICPQCGKVYRETADLGWWGYSVEIYTEVEA